MERLVLGIAAAIALGGCVEPPAPIRLTAVFDVEQAQRMLVPGKNTICGSALIRQEGGAVVTCAGCRVVLTPVTPYASERMSHIYGTTERGFLPLGGQSSFVFDPDCPEYMRCARQTVGDAQGMFEFDAIADGEYYITTGIAWRAGNVMQGGSLMQRVRVASGERKKIVLCP